MGKVSKDGNGRSIFKAKAVCEKRYAIGEGQGSEYSLARTVVLNTVPATGRVSGICAGGFDCHMIEGAGL